MRDLFISANYDQVTNLVQVSSSSELVTHLVQLPEYPQSGFWRWVPIDWYDTISAREHDRLESTGWKLIQPVKPQLADIFALSSHLAPSLMVLTPEVLYEFNTSSQWVLTKDLQFVEQYPVILTYHVLLDQNISDTALKYTPPPQKMLAGTDALIYGKTTDDTTLYHLESLGETGAKLQTIIQQGIAQCTSKSESLLMPRRQYLQYNEGWQQAKQAAQDLAKLYWQYHITRQSNTKSIAVQHLPAIFPKKSKKKTSTTSASMPASLALRGVLSGYSNAQSGASQWTQTDQKASYLYEQASDSALVEWRPEKSNIAERAELGQRLWEQVNQLSDLDGDVLLACMAQWLAHQDKKGLAWISSELILDYRGVQTRKYIDSQGIARPSTHRWEDLKAIEDCIEHIRQTHVTVQQWITAPRQPGQRGRPKKKLIKLESYILTVTDFLEQHSINKSGEAVQIGWYFQPGQCITFFLEGANHQVAQLVQQTLAYDPTHEMWEKRLARFLMFQLQLTQNLDIICTVGELMDELSLPLNASDPEKTKRRFEKAFHRLQIDQQITSWEYLVEMDSLPSKKWVEAWLAYHVRITASPLFTPDEGSLTPHRKKPKKEA